MDTITGKDSWQGTSVEECLRLWSLDSESTFKDLKGVPLIISWGIWLARNAGIFENKCVPPIQSATQAKSIFCSLKYATKSQFLDC
jgi:hypothetical protein